MPRTHRHHDEVRPEATSIATQQPPSAFCPPSPSKGARPQVSQTCSGSPTPAAGGSALDIAVERLALTAIRSATVLSQPQHPHIFSWWMLLCLSGLLLLPFPLVFGVLLELAALAGWILLGSRKQHQLLVVLHDGRALRHGFANRRTAMAHRNSIRNAICQSLETR